jgi:hypothetical protein
MAKEYVALPLPILKPLFHHLAYFITMKMEASCFHRTLVLDYMAAQPTHKTIIFIVTAVRTSHLKTLSRIPMTMAFVDQTEATGPRVCC